MQQQEDTIFSPYEILENLKKNNLDPSIFETIDEQQFPKAPNFLEFAIGANFLNTLILPKQIEIGSKLLCDYCPRCSRPGYLDTLFDQSIGNIKDNVVFLEHGICPKCKVNRFELIKSKDLIFKNELVGIAGQRCISRDSLVFTARGILKFEDVTVGDKLSHGPVLEKFDSGKLPSLMLTTKYNYTLTGAKESHIVPVLKVKDNAKRYNNKNRYTADFSVEDTLLKDCKVGDIIFLHSSNLWPTRKHSLPEYTFIPTDFCHNYKRFVFPTKVTSELARILGYMVANGDCGRKYNFRVSFNKNNPEAIDDFIKCCNIVFSTNPAIDDDRKNCVSYSMNGLALMEWLEQSVGLCKKTARYKFIPDCIMKSPKDIVCEFLSALFECDGNVYREKNTVRIQYSSVSKQLIKQVRLLLLNLGIVTSCSKFQSTGFRLNNIYTDAVDEGKEAYSITTKNGEFVRRFISHIKFVGKKKRELLSTLLPTDSYRFYTPIGYFQLKCFDKWPFFLKELFEKGYYPVPIKKIEEGPELEMMDVSIPDNNLYTADGFVHHNSGKTKLVGLLAAYTNHRFLKIPSPIRTFNQTSGDVLSGTFSGLSLEHSYRNLWQAFKGFMDSSPWFQNYHKFIRSEEKRLGVELFHELKASLFYSHKHLLWDATGSQDRKMRGATRIFGAIDELGWMISDETKTDLQNMNADAIYSALSNSLTTMRTKFNQVWGPNTFDLPPILMANISSPSSVKDKIMRLSKDAKNNDRILAVHAATWEMNSDYTYETLREDMAHIDELTFDRDFGGNPPLASNPYLPEPRYVDKIAIGEPFSNITCTIYVEKDFLGDSYKSAKLIVHKPDKLIPRLMAFDLGAQKNSLAVCVFSLNHDLKPKLDFALAIKPEAKGRIRANIAKFFEDFTVPLVNAFAIKHAFFDRWQSLDQVERLKGLGVNASIHSLTYKEMDSLRGAILSQSIIIPKLQKPMEQIVKEYVEDVQHLDPLALLGLQLLTVRDVGHKMAKPLLGDDDLFRAFVLGATKLSDPKIKEEYLKYALPTKSGHIVAYLGTVRMRSTGGGSGMGLTGNIEGENGKQLGTIRSRRVNR